MVHQRTTAPNAYDVMVSFSVQDASGAMNASVVFEAFASQGGAVTTKGGTGISATFVHGADGNQATDCSLAFTYQGKSIPGGEGIGPGHVWGHLSCTMPMGACDAETDLLVENCTQ